MNKLKLMTIVGTRPELIRLSETIKKADHYFDHIFVHTGQNYDYNLNEIFYKDLSIRKPDYYLDVAGDDLGQTMGNIIAKTYALLATLKPDAVLILGDTNSALAAISAKRLKIPIFHMEAGNRCFDENLPEEINRRIVDHVSDVNLPYTEHARRYLLAEGVRKEFIFVTGSPMAEIIAANQEKIVASTVLARMSLQERRYIVLSAHREENIDNPIAFVSLMEAINALADTYDMPVIYSVHPRSKKFIKERNVKLHALVQELPPFSFTDYSKLMQYAYCVVSDSGTLPEEAAISGFPAISIRTSTERPESLDKNTFILGGINAASVLQSVAMAVNMHADGIRPGFVPDYADLNVSDKVIRIIQSYVDVVNRRIWGKA
ncbi:UDP-N-acetylglucosamine 2-epimerase [uncultured Sporomusa sp.]|uniref:UDP-N-acetylglucosamine 2-epimerase n=1 Tax=uncultured Sporomusa sp. TaxID=307249 RepID=A0A212M1I3_9FIRM|nr:UDP-N-acetylglucosamine 2-epimerase (non-hydrolyzing) [uncultured Sporomusa sp.]SCM83673.1 UDP-N-acetylglucosamine 2-epimerase [uncultured Sporomusa sp.]